jgi:hypothetical protein
MQSHSFAKDIVRKIWAMPNDAYAFYKHGARDYGQTSLPWWHPGSSSDATHAQLVAIWTIFKNFRFHVHRESMFAVSCIRGILGTTT